MGIDTVCKKLNPPNSMSFSSFVISHNQGLSAIILELKCFPIDTGEGADKG
jgi:hypothetical protein